MSNNIGGFGLSITLIGSVTFPVGFPITQFADDADPFDIPSIQLKDAAMGLNGDLVTWAKAQPIKITLNIIPGSLDDVSLALLAEANRVGKGKLAIQDRISMVGIYPDGKTISLINGVITDAAPGNSVAGAGRMKSKSYSFVFENKA